MPLLPSSQVRFSSTTPVEPLAGTWRMIGVPNPSAFRLPPAPANDSHVTQAELAELRTLAANRTPQDVRQILRWSANEPSVDANWQILANLLAQRYQLSPPAAGRVNYLMDTAVYAALIAAWTTKYQDMRPRPSTLDPRVNPNVIPVPTHPSYPSGHSTVSGAAASILAHFFPAEAGVAQALAQDSGMSRLKAGIHYRSDHTNGLALGQQVAEQVLQTVAAQDGGPQRYAARPGQRPLTIQEVLNNIDCQHIQCRQPGNR